MSLACGSKRQGRSERVVVGKWRRHDLSSSQRGGDDASSAVRRRQRGGRVWPPRSAHSHSHAILPGSPRIASKMKKTPSDGEDMVSNVPRVVTDLLRGGPPSSRQNDGQVAPDRGPPV